MMIRVKCQRCKAETQYKNSEGYVVCPYCGEKIDLANAKADHQKKSKSSVTTIALAYVMVVFLMAFGIIAVSGKNAGKETNSIAATIMQYNSLIRTDVATVTYAGSDLQALSIINRDSDDVSKPSPTPTGASTLSTLGEAALASPTPTQKPVPTTPKNRITKITIDNDGDFETFLGGDTIQGAATVVKTDPKTYSVTDISFISTNPKVATIKSLPQKSNTELGFVIEPVSVGETYIYAKTSNGYISSNRIKVKVLQPVEAESISLNYDEYSASVGECFYLSADLSPEDTSIKKVTWTSSDSSVVFVASSGTVRALKAGEAEITATTSNGLSATCYVYVEGESSDDEEYYEDEYDYDDDYDDEYYYDEDDYYDDYDDYDYDDGYDYDDYDDYDDYYYEEDDYYEEEYYDDYSYEEYVWLSATGSKYHNRPDCGNMNPDKAYQVTISYAEEHGYDPCKKCF